MAKPTWVTSAGSLGTFEEKTTQNISLSTTGENVKLSLISGTLPPGMRFENNAIVGTPFDVAKNTIFEFVIRASNSEGAIDRTFTIEITGEDAPIWTTPAGTLDIGPNGEYYIMNKSPIDYQLSASDLDLSAGQTLEYYMDDLAGELPPGLEISSTGRITGIINAPLTLDYKATNANYDQQQYDVFPYDYGGGTEEGDAVPKYLSRYYEFEVTVTDGILRERRKFRIFVINEQQFRADTTLIAVDTEVLLSSATYLRAPIWITTGNLGVRRANNYMTLPLEVYDPNQYSGSVSYEIVPLEDSTESTLPEGLELDTTNGVLFGKIPYQPAVTTTYQFRIRVNRTDNTSDEITNNERTFILKVQGEVDSTIKFTTDTLVGTLRPNEFSTLQIDATTTLAGADVRYRLVAGNLPPGLKLGGDGTIIGKIQQIPDSGQQNGLTTIDLGGFGLNSFLLDGGSTSIDRSYAFTIQAKDYYLASAVTKDFKINITADSITQYSNIFLKPLLSKDNRNYYYNFITDNKIFTQDNLYRPSDPQFGVQKNLSMLLQHGIETLAISKYVPALATNFSRKKYTFGPLRTAEAKNDDGTVLYEVIYVEMVDELEENGLSVKDKIDISPAGNPIDTSMDKFKASTNLITVDQLINKFLYPNSTTSMQNKLTELYPDSDSTLIKVSDFYLPLWMRSIQTATGTSLGYVKAVPIAYLKPGSSISIIDNIRDSGFDFKNINFDVDRITIDSVTGEKGDKYIAFPKRKVI